MDLRQRILIFLLMGVAVVPCIGQSAVPTSSVQGSTSTTPTQADREKAYIEFFEAQRLLSSLGAQPTAERAEAIKMKAREALLHAVEAYPGLAEAYTQLAEIGLSSPPYDIQAGIQFATKAIETNRKNFGGRRLLARLRTLRSGLKRTTLTPAAAADAIKEWKAVAELDPRNAEAWAFLSELYIQTGQRDDTIDALRKWSLSAPPADLQFYRNIMGPTADLAPESAALRLASALLDAGRVGEATAILTDLISNGPQNGAAVQLLRDAIAASAAGPDQAVAEAIRRALSASPNNTPMIRLLAEISADAGELRDAELLLRNSVATATEADNARRSELLVALGDIYFDHGRTAESALVYEEALTARGFAVQIPVPAGDREDAQQILARLIRSYRVLNNGASVANTIERARSVLGPENSFADRELIAYYRATGKGAEALRRLRTMRLKMPLDPSLARLESSVVAELGDTGRAVEIIRSNSRANKVAGINTAFDEFSDLLFLSSLYSLSRSGADAKAAAEKAFEIAGDDERKQIAKTSLAQALKAVGDTRGAEAVLRELVKATPGNPIALNNLGYLLADSGGDLSEAARLIRRALEIEPANASYLDSLGWVHFKMGQFTEAERYLRRASRKERESAAIYEHLGDVLLKLNRAVDARDVWQRAIVFAVGKGVIDRLNDKIRQK